MSHARLCRFQVVEWVSDPLHFVGIHPNIKPENHPQYTDANTRVWPLMVRGQASHRKASLAYDYKRSGLVEGKQWSVEWKQIETQENQG